jgi:phosphoribosylaminoimidazolecarboxamide formyltransferase/IMP cyclohydrolase
MKLKYGCNPDQEATLDFTDYKSPFIILHGEPGYINVLDAMYAYSLVSEANRVFNQPCAASFKHTSPAGVALGSTPKEAYENARNCDPKSSFGDFIAVNCYVDEELALYIKTQVSDGIIAPNYSAGAVEILKKKKQNKFLIYRDLILF